MSDSAGQPEVGQRVRERRTRLAITRKAFAVEAGIVRDTLSAVEEGRGYNATTLAKINKALDRLEEEAGLEDIDDRFIEIHVSAFTVSIREADLQRLLRRRAD